MVKQCYIYYLSVCFFLSTAIAAIMFNINKNFVKFYCMLMPRSCRRLCISVTTVVIRKMRTV